MESTSATSAPSTSLRYVVDMLVLVINLLQLSFILNLLKSLFLDYKVEKAEDYINEDERLCTFIDDDDCRATFVYGYHNSTGELEESKANLYKIHA